MLNIVKMDIYRMFKTKVLYVTIIIAAISVIASLAAARYQLNHPEYREMMEEVLEQQNELDVNMGIQIGGMGIITEDTTTEDLFLGTLAGGMFLVLSVIFCVVFVCTDHNSGFIKNVVSRKNYRSQTSLSKAISMVIYTVVQYAVCLGIFILGYVLLFHNVNFTNVNDFIRFIAVQMLMQVAIMNLCILLCNLVRNMAFCMATGICISAGLFFLIASLIDRFDLPIKTTDYLLTVLMRTLPVTYDSTLYIRVLVISIVSIVVYQTASFITMKRQDVK